MSPELTKADPEETTLRAPRDVAQMIGAIAKFRKMTVAEYFDRVIRYIVVPEYRKVSESLTQLETVSPAHELGEAGA